VGKRQAAIYLYRVDVSHSQYSLVFRASAELAQAIAGFHGEVEVDRQTGDVLSLTSIADAIPKNFPINSSTTTVTYNLAGVGGKRYLLPASSKMEMRARDVWVRNRAQYRNYRKFSADSILHFGDAK
jgi:hypothetical protein